MSGKTRAHARLSFGAAREAIEAGRSSPTARRTRASRPQPGRGGEAAGGAIATFCDFSRYRARRRTHPKSAMAMSLTLYSRPLRVSMLHIAVGAAIFADVSSCGG